MNNDDRQLVLAELQKALETIVYPMAHELKAVKQRLASVDEALGLIMTALMKHPKIMTPNIQNAVAKVMAERKKEIDAMAQAIREQMPKPGDTKN